MNKDNFNDEIENLIRQSAEKITLPPFYSVLGKIADDHSTETYEEIFEAQTIKKKKPALKIAGIAAALVLLSTTCILLTAITLRMNISKSASQSADVNYELSEKYSEDSDEGKKVSDSDVHDCLSSDSCNDKY